MLGRDRAHDRRPHTVPVLLGETGHAKKTVSERVTWMAGTKNETLLQTLVKRETNHNRRDTDLFDTLGHHVEHMCGARAN